MNNHEMGWEPSRSVRVRCVVEENSAQRFTETLVKGILCVSLRAPAGNRLVTAATLFYV